MNDPGPNRTYPPPGEDLLPPVEPPSASFIIQLFVVPALIVLVIVGVWLLFTSLVRRSSPETILQGLEHGPSIARWQRASELADMLRNERFADFKQNAAAADHVARILDREIDRADARGGMQEQEVTLRYFLARALGKFDVNNGIDVLLKAAQTHRDPKEQLVRHGALLAIAERAYNLPQLDPPQQLVHDELEPTLLRLADDELPQLRSDTAYVLGKLGTPAAIKRLETMVDDPDADTRYNAAVALAHHGNGRATETLAEMLDPEESAGIRDETSEQDRAFKRAVIVSTAIEAARLCTQKGLSVEVVSVPMFDPAAPGRAAQLAASSPAPVKIALEAATCRLYAGIGVMHRIGLSTFGESAPEDDVVRHFHLEASQVADRIFEIVNPK